MTNNKRLREYLLLEQEAAGLALKLYNKFVQNGATTTPQEVTSLVNRFRQIQNQGQLNSKYGAVVSFDYKYPQFKGEKEEKEFELSLRDIQNYTFEQLEFLVDQFSKGENDDNRVVPVDQLVLATHTSPQLVNRSYEQFWGGKQGLVIDLGDIRVYEVLNEAHSIAFGWYLDFVQKQVKQGFRWCTTTPLGGGGHSQYGRYRGDGGTFYYVIDESRADLVDENGVKILKPGPTIQWYLSSIQVLDPKRRSEDVHLTNLYNKNQDTSWKGVFAAHPRLAPYREVFKVRPYDEDELSDIQKSRQINETPGTKYEFAIQSKRRKRDFILMNEPLRSIRSWRSMTDDLKKLYIETTYTNGLSMTDNVNKLINKFGSSEILGDIISSSMEKILTRYIRGRYQKPGTKWLSAEIFFSQGFAGSRFIVVRKSIGRNGKIDEENGYILVKNNTNSNMSYGIFDKGSGFWAKSNGILHDDGYVLSRDIKDTKPVVLPDGKEYAIFKYKKGENDYFVVLTCFEKFGNVHDGYFYFKTQWEEKMIPFIGAAETFDDIDNLTNNIEDDAARPEVQQTPNDAPTPNEVEPVEN